MNYLTNLFSSRLNRINFWAGLLFTFIVLPPILTILNEYWIYSLPIIEWVPLILAVTVLLSITTRRFHDVDKSGWSILLLFIPILNFLVPIWLVSTKGTVGKNKFGEEDKGFSIKSLFGLNTKPANSQANVT